MSQLINFGLTGREFQDHFNVEKYTALACQQPRGLKLQQLVEEHWSEWCTIVDEACWLRYWKHSNEIQQPCVTPSDKHVSVSRCGNVPLAVYSCAVWGFGLDGWMSDGSKKGTKAMYAIGALQKVKIPCTGRTVEIDDKLYRGCGLMLPPEFGDLDRWLEPMWRQVCFGVTK